MTPRHECIECYHPVEWHDRVGCAWNGHEDNEPDCTCTVTARQLTDDNQPVEQR